MTGITEDKISDDWLAWFIGFVEGDGAILMDKLRPRFVLTQKEISILIHVQETLGIGKVSEFERFGRLIATSKYDIRVLTTLFNGNLVLEKRRIQLKRWLVAQDMVEITRNVLPLLSNAWLSGLIDAEGCFNVTLFKREAMVLGYQVKLRFMIDQKDSFETLSFIRDQWNMILSNRKLKEGSSGSMLRAEINSFVRVKPVIDYLSVYRLKTKKKISFEKWVTVYELVCQKAHLTEEGLTDIRRIKKEINLIISVTGKTGDKLA